MKNQLFWERVRRVAFCSVALCLGLTSGGHAQVARYVFSQTARPYVALTGGTVVATALVGASPSYAGLSGTVHPLTNGTIPFAFAFNGSTYTGGFVASGGYLTLGPTPPFQRYTQPPGLNGRYYDVDRPLSADLGSDFEGVLAALAGDTWGNPVAGSLGEIRYQTLGTAPSRVFVVQWARMRVYGSGAGLLNYQVRLYETSNAVEFAYGPCQTDQAITVQVGLRGSTPNDFTNRTGAWAASAAGVANTAALPVGPTALPANGLVYAFAPPAPQACAVPFSLAATPAGTQAVLRWRALVPNPGPYALVWGPAGFDPATGGLGTQTVAGTNATIIGLTPSTDYEFYVTQQCGGAAGSSPPSNPPGRFRTTILNDEAVDAVDLPVLAACQPVAGTTAGATPSTGNGYNPLAACSGGTGGSATNDVWYAVTTAATGPAATALTLSVVSQDPQAVQTVRVYGSAGGSAGPFTRVFCAEHSGTGTIAPFVVAPLLPNTAYYVRVSNSFYLATTQGPFTICATVPPACGDPTNVSSFFPSNTATTATIGFTQGAGAINYTVTLTPTGGAPYVVSPAPTGPPPITLTGLSPATNFSATLQANCAGGTTSAAVPLVVSTRPANDEPAAAVPLPVGAGCVPVVGNTTNATGSSNRLGFVGGYPGTGCGTRTPNEVWYSFVTPASGAASQAVRVSVTGKAGQVRAFLPVGAGYTEVGCSAGSATAPAPPLDLIRLQPSTTYYLLVGNFSTPLLPQQGPFTICVTEPPLCGNPQGVAISGITATGANLTFIAGSPTPAGTTYTVVLTPQGGAPVTVSNSGSSGAVPLTGLVPGTYYTAVFRANCGGAAGQSVPVTLNFRTLGPSANNLCANAVLLDCANRAAAAVLAGATAAGNPATACAGIAPLGPGLWYRLVGTGDEVTVDFCAGYPQDPDLQLLVYTGTCNSLTCVGSNDNSTGCYRQLPAYTFGTVAGQDYYLLVADTGRPVVPGPASGEFNLTLRCTAPAAACVVPTGVAVRVLSPTSAAVTWAVPAAAFSYQVIWQPLAGTGAAPAPVYVVGTGSTPSNGHTATGLLPNTPYRVSVTRLCGSGNLNPPAPRSRPATADFSTVLSARNPALAALVQLYPNPARTTATLEVPAALRLGGAATATLYNALGQAVRRLALPAGAAPVALDVAGLPTGRYLLRLETPGGGIGKALVVE